MVVDGPFQRSTIKYDSKLRKLKHVVDTIALFLESKYNMKTDTLNIALRQIVFENLFYILSLKISDVLFLVNGNTWYGGMREVSRQLSNKSCHTEKSRPVKKLTLPASIPRDSIHYSMDNL